MNANIELVIDADGHVREDNEGRGFRNKVPLGAGGKNRQRHKQGYPCNFP